MSIGLPWWLKAPEGKPANIIYSIKFNATYFDFGEFSTHYGLIRYNLSIEN